jgi:transcriptional regulator with XRE-family HTH domain
MNTAPGPLAINTGTRLQLFGSTKEAHAIVLGHFLRFHRTRQGLSARELAAHTTRSTSFIGMLERGERTFTGDVLLEICKALGLRAKTNKATGDMTITYPADGGKKELIVMFFNHVAVSTADAGLPVIAAGDEISGTRAKLLAEMLVMFAEQPWTIEQAHASLFTDVH